MEVTFLYSAISLVILLLAFKLLQIRSKNLPPSPLALPLIGHLHILNRPLHRTFHRFSQKYGSIFSLLFGSRLVVVVSSFSAVEECFTKNDVVLANRPPYLVAKYLGYNYTTVVASPYGDHWRNLRRIATLEIFSTHRLNSFLGIRKEEIKRLIRKLGQNSIETFAKVEMKSMLSELAFNVMMRMVAGKRYYGEDVTDEDEARKFREIVKEITKYGGASNPEEFVTILRWMDYQGFEKKVLSLSKKADAFLQGLINEHRSKKKGLESVNTMIDRMIFLQESQPEYYTDEIIKGLIMVMLLAGIDTTSVTLEWAMANLLNNPSILKKAKAEMDQQLSQEHLIEEQDISNLPYLQNIISETLRMNPAAPLLLPHMSSAHCTIGEYHIPRGTILLVNAWSIHRDPKLWDEPTKFKPERFERGESEAQKLIPFGLGRRACPGAPLAKRVVGLTLGSLIQCFEWKRVSEMEIDMTEGKGVTMPKAEPLVAMCRACPIMNKVLLEDVGNV